MPVTIEGLPASVAARQLGVSTVWVHKLLAQGRIGYTQTALGRLLDPADVARLAAERQAKRRGGDDDPATGSAA